MLTPLLMTGAVRRERGGSEWLDVDTLKFSLDETMKQVDKDEKTLQPAWAANNPVVRVCRFEIAEKEILVPPEAEELAARYKKNKK